MLEFMKNLPDYVVAIHAVGDVGEEDYKKVLIPRINELVERQGEINYLLVLETDVQNFTVASWWEDLKLGLKNFSKWNKIAVVTDQKSVEWFSDIFRVFIPGKSRGFPLKQLDEAIKWISEKDEPAHSSNAPAGTKYSDNDDIEGSLINSSNKGQGPAGENL